MKKDPKDLIYPGFGLCEPKSDNISFEFRWFVCLLQISLRVLLFQDPGPPLQEGRLVTSIIMHEHLHTRNIFTWVRVCHLQLQPSGLYSAHSAFGFFRKGVKKATRRDLIIFVSGPSKHNYKQWKQSSASPPWPWPSPASQLMNSVEVRL